MKLKRLISLFLCAVLICATSMFALGEAPPEGFDSWDEYYDFLIYGESVITETPEVHEMNKVGENDRFTMYYYENGADVFLVEKSNGKVWGSAVDNDYIDTSDIPTEQCSNLLTVSYVDKDANLTEVNMIDAENEDFSSSVSYSDNGVLIDVSVISADIDFVVELKLLENGIRFNIPFDSIKENGENDLISIKVMPNFGAAKPGENGYIFYPDGSGALINISDYEKSEPSFYQYTYYCDDEKDFSTFDDKLSQDIKNLMLPVYGIKHTNGGVFANAISGDEHSKLHIGIDKLYEAYFEFVYRTYETVVYEYSKDSQGVNKVGDFFAKGDRTAEYYILKDVENTYSDMAVIYRENLIDKGELIKKNKTDGVPLSLELFMGISKSGILGDSLQCLTTYDDAKQIANDLYKNGITDLDLKLVGWSKGGYDTLPTTNKTDNKLGGKNKLDSLIKFMKEKGGNTYLAVDFINANKNTGSFNTKQHTVRDGLDSPITDKEEIRYWLNPVLYMNSAVKNIKKMNSENSALCFETVGSWLLSDSGDKRNISRNEIVSTLTKVLKSSVKENGNVAVSGGNKYLLSVAERLYDIPDNDSGYFQNDVTVPFYQMVIHGFVDYSSLPANMSYDYNYQKLRFIETGSIPTFIITENSPTLLQGTEYSKIFSSEYDMWKKIIVDMYTEMNERLGSVWGLTIDEHVYINSDVVKLTYSDGSSVYINYGDTDANIEGITIPSEDYVLKKGD